MDNNFNNQPTVAPPMGQPNMQQPGMPPQPPMNGQPMGQPMNAQPMMQQGMQGGYCPPPYPMRKKKTNRSMLSFILWTMLTCGFYSLFFYNDIGEDINFLASKRDGKKTMNYMLLFFIVGPLTCEIATIIWFHNISARIGDEARARGVSSSFGASSFWVWNVLGALFLVGPFIYMYKLCKTMNLICEDYNQRGY